MKKIAPFLILSLAFMLNGMAQPVNNSNAEITAEEGVSVKQVATGRVIHRFFDTSPLSPSGRFLALFRMPYENKSPQPGVAGDVVLVDMITGKERVVAKSRGWEVQLGANVQWGQSDKELLFNDVDTISWKAFCVVFDPATGKSRKLDGTVFMASNDGKKIASYNLIKSTYAQVGYGVVIPRNLIKRNVGPVGDDGIDITDIASGKTRRIVTIREMYEKSQPSIKISNPQDYEYYCFQVKWNPQGTRLLTTVQWTPLKGGARLRSVITMRADGSDLHTAVTPEQWAKGGHHVNWMPDGEHLSMNLNIDGKEGLELISVKYDGTDMKTVFTPGSGHPSFHPNGLPLIITDAYPNEPITKQNGTVPIRLLNTETGKEEHIAEVFVSNTEGEFRVDPHPAWDRSGRYVIFNGYVGKTRSVFIADLKEKIAVEKKATKMNTSQTILSKNINWNTLPQHPRLLANDDRLASIELQKDKVTVQLLSILQKDADQKLSASKIVYPGEVSNMGTSRNVQGRIISLALAYRFFKDDRYLVKAKEELLQLAALKDWGVGHFLDVGEAALAAGIGYDWLYNYLREDERKTVAQAIKTKALLASLQVKEQPNNTSWVNGNFNWNPVCHGGLIVGALAIAEREPELSKQIVERAVKNIPIAGDAYSPDGSFAEGPSYWSYGTTFYALATESLRSALGTTYNLEKVPGFLKTADYYVQMQAPSGQEYNYSDYHLENLNEPVMFWFAKELSRSDLMTEELQNIERIYGRQKDTAITSHLKEGTIAMDRHTPFELLWWDPNLANQQAKSAQPLQWTADGLMPIGVMRSSWNDPKASFIAIKGGTPNNSHGHMDAGSFIIEADGVRWALDLGTENYNKMRQAKLDLWNYSQNSDRWSTFRVGPEGHNIIRFDSERQLITGKGEVKQLSMSNGTMGSEADLTSLYTTKANKVRRSVLLNPDRSISIRDEWTTKDKEVEYSFQWLTKATVTKTDEGLLLQQDGQSLLLKVERPLIKNINIDIEDVSAAKQLQDSPNPGLSRIVIKMKTAANSNGTLSLHVIPGSKMSTSKSKKQA